MQHFYRRACAAWILGVVAFAAVPTWAATPWVWLDERGQKVYSDLPPPPQVPNQKILSRPGQVPLRLESEPGEAAATPPAPATKPPATEARPTPADPAEATKRAETERKAEAERKAIERRNAEIRADNCQRAQTSLATLNTGGRLATVNESGQRIVMDEGMRAAERARLEQIIRDNCR